MIPGTSSKKDLFGVSESLKSRRLSHIDRMKTFHLSLPRKIPGTYKHIASVMFTYAHEDGGGIYASVRTIAEQAGESERTVKRVLAHFAANGWLVDDGVHFSQGGIPVKYRRLVTEKLSADRDKELMSEDDFGGDIPDQGVSGDVLQGVTPGMEGVSSQVKGGVTPGKNPKTPLYILSEHKEEHRIEHKNEPPTLFGGSASFDRFWEAYPRKEKKQDAIVAFEKAVRKAHPSTIIQGLMRLLPGMLAKEKGFVPHAATWLNGERWEDELVMPASGRPENGGSLGGMAQISRAERARAQQQVQENQYIKIGAAK